MYIFPLPHVREAASLTEIAQRGSEEGHAHAERPEDEAVGDGHVPVLEEHGPELDPALGCRQRGGSHPLSPGGTERGSVKVSPADSC